MTNIEELEFTNEALIVAKDYNLESEVVWSALKAMKEHPEWSIEDALIHALVEWDI